MHESVMVLCIIGNCGSKSGRDSICFYSVPAIVTNQGEEFEELTRERRNLWISAIDCADLKTKNVLQNERVCSRHFVSGRPAANWERFNEDWVPTIHLTKSTRRKMRRLLQSGVSEQKPEERVRSSGKNKRQPRRENLSMKA